MDILIQAFACAFKDMDVELIVVGDGIERPKLESLVISCGIESQVSFLGNLNREDVKIEMQRCDAFVLASRYETFGVVYIEALACGKPIIATSCGGPAMIVDEENGLLVPVEDIKALSEAMSYLFTHYDNYKPETIRKNCINKYSEEVIIGKISDIYNRSLK
jgi:glycosyltransferase involved in cell wall biosynthesis